MKPLSIMLFLLLAGCSLSESQGEQVQKIREFTQRLCGFLPTVGSVTAIISASNPAVSGTLQVATAICDAVAEKPDVSALKSECPQVNGVCVEGEFVAPLSGEKE